MRGTFCQDHEHDTIRTAAETDLLSCYWNLNSQMVSGLVTIAWYLFCPGEAPLL